MALAVGQVVENRYRIAKLLGQGGFGAVYRAWDIRLNRPCALKENLDPSAEAERQFTKEATILANLKHPNLPRVIDHFVVAGEGQYLVMDFVEGEDLQEMLDRRGPRAEAEALPWIAQICDALAYLHSQAPPIIHRDVKPANVKITPDGQPMLVDFGIAKVYDPVLRTTTGARAVTPGYSPPEQYGRGRTDPRSDIYALGATLYALLTGQEPADSVECLLGAATLVPPRQINPRISQPVAEAIMKAMAVDPAQRFQSAEGFKAALGTWFQPHPARPVVTTAHPPQATAPAVGALTGAVPRLDAQVNRKARNLALTTLILGLLSWILSCVQPIVTVLAEDPLGLASGTLAFPCAAISCLGYVSALATFVTGGLELTRYRAVTTKGYHVMTIGGMLAGGLMLLTTLVLIIALAVGAASL